MNSSSLHGKPNLNQLRTIANFVGSFTIVPRQLSPLQLELDPRDSDFLDVLRSHCQDSRYAIAIHIPDIDADEFQLNTQERSILTECKQRVLAIRCCCNVLMKRLRALLGEQTLKIEGPFGWSIELPKQIDIDQVTIVRKGIDTLMDVTTQTEAIRTNTEAGLYGHHIFGKTEAGLRLDELRLAMRTAFSDMYAVLNSLAKELNVEIGAFNE